MYFLCVHLDKVVDFSNQLGCDNLQDWLRPYAAFCFLRDLFGTADHSQWGSYSEFTPEKVFFQIILQI